MSKDTEYCYKILSINEQTGIIHTKPYPHFKCIGYEEETVVIEEKEHPCQTPVYYCSYTKMSTKDDFLLADWVKICGERLPKY